MRFSAEGPHHENARRRRLPAARRLLASLALALALVAVLAPAALAAVVSRIVVEGNTRVDAETVRAYVTITPGRSFGPADIDESIDALFGTGLFADVAIAQRGSALVVTVEENPIINRVAFEGNRRLSDETLEGAVRSRSRGVLTRSSVQNDVQLILETYRRRGNYQASVDPKIIDLGNGRVDLVFEIDEGEKTEVARITFIGNNSFSDGRLRDVINTRESGLLGFIRTTDTYDPDRLLADQELIRRFYYNHGFADFRIISAVADFDRERNAFFITITVDEGDKYTFGEIEVDTTLRDVDPDALRRVVTTRSGRTYSSERVEETLENLTIEATNQGYAFAEVRPRADRNFADKTISIVYQVEEGPRAFIERINIIGNTTTRDYVIRREFDIVEGDAFNRILLDRAERRLNNLGFFETVRITTEPGTEPDRVIVNVFVEEKATGKVSFGVGYSTADGIIGDISIEERNFLGRGQYVKFLVGGGENTTNVEFSFTEPFFMGRRIAAGFDVYNRTQDATGTVAFDTRTTGGGVRFGLPINEPTTFEVYYQLFEREVTIPDFNRSCVGNNAVLSRAICDSEGSTVTSLIGGALIFNTLDNQFNPRDGIFVRSTNEFAGLGGDVSFYRHRTRARAYKELVPSIGLLGMIGGEFGLIEGLGEDLRVQDQFFAGGAVIRGFETSGIGPRDAVTGDALGGRYLVAATAEAIVPLPLLPPEIGIRGAGFVDAASLWGADPDIIADNQNPVVSDDFDMRVSAGFGFQWASPFGPIRADFAWPLVKNDADEEQVFRLSGGTRF